MTTNEEIYQPIMSNELQEAFAGVFEFIERNCLRTRRLTSKSGEPILMAAILIRIATHTMNIVKEYPQDFNKRLYIL